MREWFCFCSREWFCCSTFFCCGTLENVFCSTYDIGLVAVPERMVLFLFISEWFCRLYGRFICCCAWKNGTCTCDIGFVAVHETMVLFLFMRMVLLLYLWYRFCCCTWKNGFVAAPKWMGLLPHIRQRFPERNGFHTVTGEIGFVRLPKR